MESWNFSCVHQHSDERRLVTEYCLLLAASRPGCRQNLVLPPKSCVCLTRSGEYPAVHRTRVSAFAIIRLQKHHENYRRFFTKWLTTALWSAGNRIAPVLHTTS